jgi:hypothetical protein
MPLLRSCAGLDPSHVEFCDESGQLPAFDVFASLMSLPRLFQTDLATIPADVPYLSVSAELVARWRSEMGDGGTLKVGIAWQGNPNFVGDRTRSFPLSTFAPLAAIPGVQLFSLQKGFGCEQIAGVDFPVVDLGSKFGDELMLDAAAVIQSLDLVISCDSAIGHLAGALAAEAWIALPFAPDWRWLLDREDSPWYPTLRLFRQSRPGDWAGVFQLMAGALAPLTSERTNAGSRAFKPDASFLD